VCDAHGAKAEVVEEKHDAGCGCNPVPQHHWKLAVPTPYKARPDVQCWVPKVVHGRSQGRPHGGAEASATVHRDDDRTMDCSMPEVKGSFDCWGIATVGSRRRRLQEHNGSDVLPREQSCDLVIQEADNRGKVVV
jgi:hypothetical protein